MMLFPFLNFGAYLIFRFYFAPRIVLHRVPKNHVGNHVFVHAKRRRSLVRYARGEHSFGTDMQNRKYARKCLASERFVVGDDRLDLNSSAASSMTVISTAKT